MVRFQHAGLLNLNKPPGMTSRGAVDLVVRAAGTGRVGHAGTLDPMATGVLIVCVGWTTRLVPYVQQLPKVYRAEFTLGMTSDTDDATGIVQGVADAVAPDRSTLADALSGFVGRIQQVPPRHSAIHVGGRRAYELARSGVAVELSAREVEIYRLDLESYEYPTLALEIECGSGTYIRSLARDLGEQLGCGALMSRLERRSIGAFRVEDSVSPKNLTAENLSQHLLPPVTAVRHLSRYEFPAESLAALRQGKPLRCPESFPMPTHTPVALIAPEGRLAALAEFDPARGVLQPRQVFPDAGNG